MGIPGYYGKFLTREVREAIIYGLPPIVHYLLFDLNGVFHAARAKVFGQTTSATDPRLLAAIAKIDQSQINSEIFKHVEEIILTMVRAANPRDGLIICVDGVAPGAKLAQQKGRREKASRERSIIETFDKNAITAGTDFMMEMDKQLTFFIAKHRDELPPLIIYSSHLVPGEGEHKIMELFRKGEVGGEDKVCVLYGLDADLIMLSLLAPVNHIYLARETVKESIDIDVFKRWIYNALNIPNSVEDFIIMMFLLGNDFLPHQPSLEDTENAVTSLINLHTNGKFLLTGDDKKIDWKEMKRLFAALYAFEKDYALPTRAGKRYDHPSKILQESVQGNKFIYSEYVKGWYQNALGYRGQTDYVSSLMNIAAKYQPGYYDYLIDSKLSQQKVSTLLNNREKQIIDMVTAYCKTIEWNYLYYREGTFAINHDWYYPYYHCPLFKDLSEIGSESNFTGYEAHPEMMVFNVLQQLVAVLPLKSINLLPQELHPLFSYNSPIRDMYPSDFIVEIDGKNNGYNRKTGKSEIPQGVPIVPFVDRRRVFEAVQQIPFSLDRLINYLPAEAQRFTRPQHKQEEIDIRKRDAEKRQRFLEEQERYRRKNEQKILAKAETPTLTPSFSRSSTKNPELLRTGRGNFRGQSFKEQSSKEQGFRSNFRGRTFEGQGPKSNFRGQPSKEQSFRNQNLPSSNLPSVNLSPVNLSPFKNISPQPTIIMPTTQNIPVLSPIPIGSNFTANVGKIEPETGIGQPVPLIDTSSKVGLSATSRSFQPNRTDQTPFVYRTSQPLEAGQQKFTNKTRQPVLPEVNIQQNKPIYRTNQPVVERFESEVLGSSLVYPTAEEKKGFQPIYRVKQTTVPENVEPRTENIYRPNTSKVNLDDIEQPVLNPGVPEVQPEVTPQQETWANMGDLM